MIKVGEQIKIEFGQGDIRIVSSGELDGAIGYLALENQDPPRPIGKNTEQEGGAFDPDSYPILMSFTKVESVDALMGELQRVRDIMEPELIYEVIYNVYVALDRGKEKVPLMTPKLNSITFDSEVRMNGWLKGIAGNPAYEIIKTQVIKRKEDD